MENIQSKSMTASTFTSTATSTSAPVSFLQWLDRIPGTVCKWFSDPTSKGWVINLFSVGMIVLPLLSLWYLWKLTRTMRVDDDDDATMEKNHTRAKYLVRESARLVASAIEKRTINVFEAYEDATQAAVMARTAKEIDKDAAKLSEDLGVDFFEYLSYTNTVLQELRSTLKQQTGF